MTAPSPKYTLRQSFAGGWYLIPFIMEWKWEQWNTYKGKPKVAPAWARHVRPEQLVFERPETSPP